MDAFIKAGTEVVILRNGQYVWYTTAKQVTVKEWHVAPCPIRNGVTVLTAEIKGYRIWFLENQLSVELTQEMKDVAQNIQLCKIEYDIPARVSQRPQDYQDENGDSFVHPSIWMWHYGVRTTKSCWIVKKESVPWRRLKLLDRQGCQWDVDDINPSNATRKIGQAVVNLRREWIDAEQRYSESMESAQTRLDAKLRDAATQQDRDTAERQYKYDCNRVERTLRKDRENIRKGASVLRIPEYWITTGRVPTEVLQASTGREQAVNRANAHVAAVDSLNRAGHTAIADAVESGNLPHDIAADYAEDNEVAVTDDDGNEYDLRSAFSEDDE